MSVFYYFKSFLYCNLAQLPTFRGKDRPQPNFHNLARPLTIHGQARPPPNLRNLAQSLIIRGEAQPLPNPQPGPVPDSPWPGGTSATWRDPQRTTPNGHYPEQLCVKRERRL